jgi:hypothetical protein
MPKFTAENASAYGRQGGQRSHQHLEQHYAALVMSDPSAAERVARLIQQGFRLIVALRAVRESDQLSIEKDL